MTEKLPDIEDVKAFVVDEASFDRDHPMLRSLLHRIGKLERNLKYMRESAGMDNTTKMRRKNEHDL